MMVNSKLTAGEKVIRKEYLREFAELNGKIFSFPLHNATVAVMPEFPCSRMMLVSVSIAERREKRFKRKVGEYHALRKMFSESEFIKLPTVFGWSADYDEHEYALEWAENFASSFIL